MGADLQRQLPELHRLHHLRMDERAVPRQGIRHRRGRERLHHQRRAHRRQQPAARHQRQRHRPRQLHHHAALLRVHRHRRRRPSGHGRGEIGRHHAAHLHGHPRRHQRARDHGRPVAQAAERRPHPDHHRHRRQEREHRAHPVLRQGCALHRVRADRGDDGRRYADQGARQHSGQFPGRQHPSGLDLQQRQRRRAHVGGHHAEGAQQPEALLHQPDQDRSELGREDQGQAPPRIR